MKRLCTICARGGSKGVPGKNLRPLMGKPLLAHSIEQARDSGLFDAVAVSSDSEDILAVAREWGTDYAIPRPAELAADTAAKIPAIRHCADAVEQIKGINYDTITDLDATAPLRNREDILGAHRLLDKSGAANVVTGMPSRRSPYFNLVEVDDDGRVRLSKPPATGPATAIVRRQDSPECFDLNASIFIWTRTALFADNAAVIGGDTRIYVMPEERSIDIDTETDFLFVEFLMEHHVSQEGNEVP
jgi:N-acylneuraminate cytidylyltransferase/CMP-N,N'-diacetyllegionaminic acid synthase